MKTVGIVSEYNPFHNGHLYHLEQTKRITGCENIIAVMSGDFVQRGEPAIINKFVRTHMALISGVDAVIELPTVFSSASAESFAYGAVMLLDSLGFVDAISFGSESRDILKHVEAAKILSDEPEEYKKYLKTELNSGCSYPTARQKALEKLMQCNADFLEHPNNILGIEYLKALRKLNSDIKPIAVKRVSASHNSTTIDGTVCSATAIRKAIAVNDFEAVKQAMPLSVFDLLMNEVNTGRTTSLNNLSNIFQYIMKIKKSDEIAEILDIVEGLENRILRCSEKYFYLDDIINAIKTKRYTLAGLRRAVLHIILDIRASEAAHFLNAKNSCYIRILGFKKDKSKLIKQIQEHASLPVVMRMKKDAKDLSLQSYNMLQTQLRASDIFCLATNDRTALYRKNIDLYRHPIIL